MAFDFSKLNFFSRLDARARVLVLFGGLVGVGVLIYVLVSVMSSGSTTTGPSSVANAPQGLQSVPGGQLTPEYYRALTQANNQKAQQAQISGGSAIPTLINAGPQAASGNCTVLCGDDSTDVKNSLDDWVRQGKISAETSNFLQELAAKNVSVAEYAAELDRLVKEGKLTPEQARMLLEQYKKQHANSEAKESAKTMDAYIKDGKLSLEAANELLAAQKRKASPAEYSEVLKKLVKEGKVDADTAQRLMNQYMQQRSKEIVMQSIMSIKKMGRAGQVTPDVEKELVDMEQRMVPLDEYAGKLKSFVDSGKLTPAVSSAILDEFKQQKQDMGNVSSIDSMIKGAEDSAYANLRNLQSSGKISQDTANQIASMIQQKVPYSDFKAAIDKLVKEGKLTPEAANQILADYKKVKDLRDLAGRLSDLQANNSSCAEHETVLKAAVAAGETTPDEAAQLLKDCQNAQLATPVTAAGGDDGGFAALQQRLQASQTSTTANPLGTTGDSADAFAMAQSRAAEDEAQARQARIEAIAANMQGQAGQLIAAWAPPVMDHKEALPPPVDKDKLKAGANGANGAAGDSSSSTAAGAADKPIIVKAGTILFAVLDTAVNSDYVDSPVMATIVDGKYKGAKMLGKVVTTKGVSGQMDRVTLNFSMMNMDAWPKSRTVTAYAIDPDTARTVLASEVNYHYMQRFGAMMATSFMSGYGQAAQSSGGQSVTSAFGTSSTNPTLSPSGKMAVAIGQMAAAVGDATKNYVNMPPTVKVDSGVGLGILFMADVT